MAGIKVYHFLPSGLYYRLSSEKEAVAALKIEGGFIWLNYTRPVREDLMKLIGLFDIHPLSVEDCLDASQIPKIEHFSGNTFLIINSAAYSQKTVIIDELDFFVGNDFLITVNGIGKEGRAPLENIENAVLKDNMTAQLSPSMLMYMIMDVIVDRKLEVIEAVEDDLEQAEEMVINNTERFDPTELITLRRSLLTLRKSLFHERELFTRICRRDCQFIRENEIYQYRDIYDHIVKLFELTENYREMLTSLMELYTSLLNNIMTKSSNQTNKSVRRLTLIATIFMPLTLIAGIGGMSEWTMITGQENWKLAYPLFMLGMVITGMIVYLIIKALEKRDKG